MGQKEKLVQDILPPPRSVGCDSTGMTQRETYWLYINECHSKIKFFHSYCFEDEVCSPIFPKIHALVDVCEFFVLSIVLGTGHVHSQ